MKARAFIPLAIFFGLVVLMAIGLTMDPKKVESPLIGRSIPTFRLSTVMDENKFVTEKELLGQVVIVNVWASWCPSCRQEHPVLSEYARTSKVPIYGLNWKDQRKDAVRWLNFFGNPYVVSLHDPNNKVGLDWGVYGAPETFVVDQKGVIHYKYTGPVTQEVLNSQIIPLVNKLKQGGA
jgi:cytochrome c biogenesis protein CcmG/thiol:disulfide interchange protein DsbE